MLKYTHLVLDHDDTVVDSTPQLHYPAFVKNMQVLRPGVTLTLEDFMLYCFEPGFNEMCRDIYGFSEEEAAYQFEKWLDYIHEHIPTAFDGMKEILEKYVAEGGKIYVVSHSMSENILRDYKANGLPLPEKIFGWELPPEKRKPNAYPLEEIMRTAGCKAENMLVVDDLKPGYEMAKKCGVPFACAGWSNDIQRISDFMHANCDFYLNNVAELETLLFRRN